MSPPTAAELEGYRGGAIHAISGDETQRLWERYATSHEAFYRPPTEENRFLDWAMKGLFRHRRLNVADAEAWLDSSLQTFAAFVDDPSALEEVRQGTIWFVCDSPPPDRNVWSGECWLDKGRDRPPITFLYAHSIACRLPRGVFDLGWTGALDHFVGHLYPYFQEGSDDPNAYDETAACRNQHLAAQIRSQDDPRFRFVARMLPLVYFVHKRIALSAYRWLGKPRRESAVR